ncbi:MAG: P-II family nitrogen regulator [Fimbriimonadaceae bacterium]|nr:MAG: P-II family nitrogen regulator [Fimbriimonadaceae bacterium]
MVSVIAFVRPHKIEEIKSALALLPISGLTIADARGAGNNEETPITFMGKSMAIPLPIRTMIEVVVPTSLAETVISAIRKAAHTGEPGDGKIFVEKITQAIRIRTLERDIDAV